MSFPTIELDEVFHVGTMRKTDRSARSYEGDTLSVSLHPDEWRKIARLDGVTWSLKRNSSLFLDMSSVDDLQKKEIMQWGLDNDLITLEPHWECWNYDSELETWTYTTHATKKEAIREMDYDLDDLNDDALESLPEELNGNPIRKIEKPVLTKKGFDKSKLRSNDGFDMCCIWFAEDFLSSLNDDMVGVWWNDKSNRYSSPRGCIFDHKLNEFEISDTTDDDHTSTNKIF